jgi:hypothetical protein
MGGRERRTAELGGTDDRDVFAQERGIRLDVFGWL